MTIDWPSPHFVLRTQAIFPGGMAVSVLCDAYQELLHILVRSDGLLTINPLCDLKYSYAYDPSNISPKNEKGIEKELVELPWFRGNRRDLFEMSEISKNRYFTQYFNPLRPTPHYHKRKYSLTEQGFSLGYRTMTCTH